MVWTNMSNDSRQEYENMNKQQKGAQVDKTK